MPNAGTHCYRSQKSVLVIEGTVSVQAGWSFFFGWGTGLLDCMGLVLRSPFCTWFQIYRVPT